MFSFDILGNLQLYLKSLVENIFLNITWLYKKVVTQNKKCEDINFFIFIVKLVLHTLPVFKQESWYLFQLVNKTDGVLYN